MTITELRETTPGKFVVGFSDGTEMRLSLDVIADLSLFRGKELTEAEYENIRSSVGFSSCKERALKIIGARPMSCKELNDRLLEKGETPENSENCIEWLIGLHYLDDAQYAGIIVRHYSAKGYGVQRIKNELFRRGVPKTLWEEAFSEMPENNEKVYDLLCRKLKNDNPDRAELKRATDALFRRGFSWDEIRSAVNKFNSERSEY